MKNHASMNRIYRLVWSAALCLWVAVAENSKGCSKGGSGRSSVTFASVLTALALIAPPWQPTYAASAANATVVVGSGSVSTAGNTTTINQGTARLAIDWTSLSTRANEALVFNQPNAQAIALNRITGTSPSELLGSLTANGQVFILNPNGVLFGAGSQVNVGGLVASTLNMSNADFEAGIFKFTGNGSRASVVNQGSMTAASGGYLALLAPEVRNEGVMTASLGTALLAAGNKVTLNLDNGSLLGYSIDQGAVNALADNKQLIKADGGQVLLSAKAMDALTTATVNNTGVIEAKTIQNKAGRILLMGDMETGTVNVGGILDASAPNGGDGGFIETSAANFKIAPDAKITALAVQGKAGTWLIDPTSVTIAGGAGAASNTVYESTIEAATSNVLIQATDSIIASGTFGGADVVVPSGLNLTIQTTATGGGTGIDLTSSAHGAALTFKTSGGGNISMSTGNTAQTLKTSNLEVSGSGTITLNSLGPLDLSGVTVKTAGGAITLTGLGTTSSDGVKIDTTTVDAGSGDLTITGSSTTGGAGVKVNAATLKGKNINVSGTATSVTGISLANSSVNATGNLTLNNAATFSNAVTLLAGTASALTLNGVNAVTQASDNLTLQGNTLVSQSGSYSANTLSIKTANGIGSSTTALQATANQLALQSTVGGGIYVTNTGNVTVAAASTGGDIVLRSANNMTVGTVGTQVGITSTGTVNLETTGAASNLTLNQAVTSTATGNAVVLKAGSSNAAGVATGGQFINNVGTGGISATNGRYLVYSGAPGTTTEGVAGYSKRYNASASFVPAGVASTFVYRIAPTLGITATTGTKVYDATLPTHTFGTTGLIDGDTIATALTGSLVRTGGKNVLGGDAVTVGTLAALLGYGVTYVGANYAITAKALTVTGQTANKTYDATSTATLAGGSVAAGVIGGDTVTLINGTGSFADKNVGTAKTITVTGTALGGADSANYSVTNPTGLTANITAKALSFTVTADNKVYDGRTTAVATLGSLSGFVGTETVSVTAANATFNSKDVATANLVTVNSASLADGANGGLASNYAITAGGTAAANITARPLSVSTTGVDKVYDGTTGASVAHTDNRVAGDNLGITSSANYLDKNVANGKTINVTGIALSSLDASNYALSGTTASTTANITPKALGVTANDDSRVAGGAAYGGGNGVRYSGFVAGEGATVLTGALSYGGTSQGAIAAGSYAITPGGLATGNYTVSYASGVLSIAAAPALLDTSSPLLAALGSPVLVRPYESALQLVGSLGAVLGGGGAGAGGSGAGGGGTGAGGAGGIGSTGGVASGGTDAGRALGAGTNPNRADE